MTEEIFTATDHAEVFDGSNLSGNQRFEETLQFLSRKVIAVADVVECVDRERSEHCFVIDLATGLEKIQVEMFAERFTFCQDEVAVSLHTQRESQVFRQFVLTAR